MLSLLLSLPLLIPIERIIFISNGDPYIDGIENQHFSLCVTVILSQVFKSSRETVNNDEDTFA